MAATASNSFQLDSVRPGGTPPFHSWIERLSRRIKRHFGVVAEEVRGDVRLVADGLQGLREEFLFFRKEAAREFDDTRGPSTSGRAKR